MPRMRCRSETLKLFEYYTNEGIPLRCPNCDSTVHCVKNKGSLYGNPTYWIHCSSCNLQVGEYHINRHGDKVYSKAFMNLFLKLYPQYDLLAAVREVLNAV